jgi:signal transduction histidine kinase
VAVATLRELMPGQAAAAEATVAAERTLLAGDLHAVVLPGLRRAIAEAESGGDPDTLARHLRSIDLELERLMADRWPVVLEAFGLVAALEDLAERIEADSRLAVQIDVERAGERPPAAIERAAWRMAQIAIDNAVRHAAASLVSIVVSVDPDRLSLVVADDGRGFDPAAAGAVRAGARGLADATRRAGAIGATIRIDARPAGGTTVAFDWAARRP